MHAYKPFPRILVVFLIVMILSVGARPATPVYAAPTFTVNSALDQPDDLSIPGTCHTADGTCTLRAAITLSYTAGTRQSHPAHS